MQSFFKRYTAKCLHSCFFNILRIDIFIRIFRVYFITVMFCISLCVVQVVVQFFVPWIENCFARRSHSMFTSCSLIILVYLICMRCDSNFCVVFLLSYLINQVYKCRTTLPFYQPWMRKKRFVILQGYISNWFS